MCGTSRASAKRSSAHTSPENVVELSGAAILARKDGVAEKRGEIGMGTVDCGCEMVWLDLAWPLLLLLGRLVNVDCSKVKTFF
jgi:hypothetical protein